MSETNITENSGHADSTIPETLKEKLHLCEALCKEMENLSERPGIDIRTECERLRCDFEAALDLPPEFEELLRKRFNAAVKALEFAAEENARRDAEFAALKADMKEFADAGELATFKELEQIEKKCQRFVGANPGFADSVNAELAILAPLRERLAAEAAQEKAATEQADKLTAELP